ncbi:MAG: hypothetical protein ACKPEY_12080, partial [Planctomycetota bacterium]
CGATNLQLQRFPSFRGNFSSSNGWYFVMTVEIDFFGNQIPVVTISESFDEEKLPRNDGNC